VLVNCDIILVSSVFSLFEERGRIKSDIRSNITELSPYRKTNSWRIPCLLWKRKFPDHVQRDSPLIPVMRHVSPCKFLGFRSSVNECNVGIWFPTFRYNVGVSSSRVVRSKKNFTILKKGETTTFSRNVGKQIHNDAATHSRRADTT
jgi:hypothetical protein